LIDAMLPFVLGEPPRPNASRRKSTKRPLSQRQPSSPPRSRALLVATIAVPATVFVGLAIQGEWALLGLAIAFVAAIFGGRDLLHALSDRRRS
jgi:hypothetical protein